MKSVATSLAICLASATSFAQDIDFERDVFPILEENCLGCHGEDEQESNLRLDRRSIMLRGGDSGLPTLVPGKPDASHMLQLIKHAEDGMEMPPEQDKLPDKSIAIIEKWIQQGAKWPGQMDDKAAAMSGTDHWAFIPVKREQPPGGPANPIDAFLAASLKEAGIEPNATADARSLIRRASVVLTGLAPTPQETKAFTAAFEKDADGAYEQLIDRLLASPHFGERWAQHWLDVIRWAETNGSEANLYRKNAWFYRDYVVRAFNEDKPYDQFVREQIAGDTLGAGDATGFLVAGPHVPAATIGQEATAIRQARADRMDEVMQTVGASMLGLTVGCARCHNHKFDPISITDYYSMTAVFQDIEFGGRHVELAENHPRQMRGKQLMDEIEAARKTLITFGGWEEHWGAYKEAHFRPSAKVKSIRVKFKSQGVGLDELEVFGPDDPSVNLAHKSRGTRVSGPDELVGDPRNVITRLNDGEYGTMAWRARAPKGSKDRPWAQYDFAEPVSINRIRLSSNREYFYDTDYLEKKAGLAFKEYSIEVLRPDGEWKPWFNTWWVNNKLNEKPERKTAMTKLTTALKALGEEGPQPGFVGRFVEPVVTRVFHRGSPESPKAEVAPAAPVVLNGDLHSDSSTTGSQRRRRFAEWVVNKNPLAARVMANRIWHHTFGQGIVSTTSDFGTAGAKPTHPELLDWLAAEFQNPTDAKPWSVKSMIRLLVTSDAFKRSSEPNKLSLAKDAGSAKLWRYPPRRVEAEVIRDSILQASGSLDRTMGGRGYRIHNVKKTYAQWQVLNNHGPDTWRRMIYQERMRRVDDKLFTAFDFPDCGQVRAKRPVSTTPLQALNLMNSNFVMDQSKRIAQRAARETEGASQQINRCFDLLLGRLPTEDERNACLELAESEDVGLVCRALINSNEFTFLP